MLTCPQKAAGLLYGYEAHHLDHLAVVCCLMEIPLIVTEESIADAAKKYYPKLEVQCLPYLEIPEKLVQEYDLIFYSIPRALFDEIFFFAQQFLRKKIHTIWCPHGNSDKGHSSFFMEALSGEEAALVYGPKMIDFLIQKKAYDQLKVHVATGNLRYFYYRRNKEFYDKILKEEVISRVKPSPRVILYAPTWRDTENSTSFYDAFPLLADNLPENTTLIVKMHPNLLIQEGGKADRILWDYEDKHNILFLKEFPLVYPLLDYVDIYIGDMSSIGYDFLAFDKPMFFLNQNKRDPRTDLGLYLYRCGVGILPDDYPEIYEIIDRYLPDDTHQFSKIRKEVYAYTFGKEKKWEDLRKEIRESYKAFQKDDM